MTFVLLCFVDSSQQPSSSKNEELGSCKQIAFCSVASATIHHQLTGMLIESHSQSIFLLEIYTGDLLTQIQPMVIVLQLSPIQLQDLRSPKMSHIPFPGKATQVIPMADQAATQVPLLDHVISS